MQVSSTTIDKDPAQYDEWMYGVQVRWPGFVAAGLASVQACRALIPACCVVWPVGHWWLLLYVDDCLASTGMTVVCSFWSSP